MWDLQKALHAHLEPDLTRLLSILDSHSCLISSQEDLDTLEDIKK